MDFTMWEPVYGQILDDFGFGRTGDECARDALVDLVKPFDCDRLSWVGATVAVCGAALTLDAELDRLDDPDVDVVVVASAVADAVRDAGFNLDLMVADLDKNPETVIELTESGVPVAAYAHGDNLPAVREWIPQFDADHVLGMTQAIPVGPVASWGGFTDDDQVVFVADELGAKRLVFVGWDLDGPTMDAMKTRKLRWAERLFRRLERHRDERFSVPDGRRDGIDPFP